MLPLIGTVALLSCGLAAETNVQKELALLEGEWQVVALESDGKPVPESLLKGFTLTIKPIYWSQLLPAWIADGIQDVGVARYVSRHSDKDDKRVQLEGLLTIYIGKVPKALDAMQTTVVKAGEKRYKQLAIYRLDDGGKTLVLCNASPSPDSKRPIDYDTRRKGVFGLTLLTLKRVSR